MEHGSLWFQSPHASRCASADCVHRRPPPPADSSPCLQVGARATSCCCWPCILPGQGSPSLGTTVHPPGPGHSQACCTGVERTLHKPHPAVFWKDQLNCDSGEGEKSPANLASLDAAEAGRGLCATELSPPDYFPTQSLSTSALLTFRVRYLFVGGGPVHCRSLAASLAPTH